MIDTNNAEKVDWSKFDQYPEDTITCQCGAVYRSHAKGKIEVDAFVLYTRKPCPGCGKTSDHVRRVSSDPELVTLKAP